MIYKIEKTHDLSLEKMYKEIMGELNEFYGINWTTNQPRIFVVEDRKTIDALQERETKRWIVGWSEPRNIFVLGNNKMEKESSHEKHSEKEYRAFLKHEVSHAFFRTLAGMGGKPKWLWEGVAIYTSGQLEFRERPEKFTDFLEFYEQDTAEEVYRESGFAVEILVERFGKEKLLNLIKNLKNLRSKEEFEAQFEEIYGFKPTYAEFNNLLCQSKN